MVANDELLINGHDSKTLFENSLLRTNIFEWYDFSAGGSLAMVGEDCPVIFSYFKEAGLNAIYFSWESFLLNEKKFEYVVLLGGADEAHLKQAATSLTENGTLFIAVQNANGMMQQAKLPFANNDKSSRVRKVDLEKWLSKAKLNSASWYYPYPDYRLATEIYSDLRLPKEGLVVGDFPSYEGDYLPAVDVTTVYQDAVSSGKVAEVMNSFFVVCEKCNVTYVKFNTLRSPKYRITTILGEENGQPFVEKRTQGEAARGHLGLVARNHDLVLKAFNMVTPVGFVRGSKDRVRYDFVAGRSLLSSVDFSEVVLQQLVAVAEASFGTIFSTECDNICPFAVTDEFKEFFGEVKVSALLGGDAFLVSNLDSIFENFILGDEIYLIDYEWMVDFPVPVDYLKYRTILYLYREKRVAFERAGLSLGVLLEAFGYTEPVVKACESLERAFQLRTHGEDLRYNYLPHYQWRVWEKKDGVEFRLRQLKNKLKK